VSTLHILRNLDARYCLETLDVAAGDAVLLVQDGVLHRGQFPCPVSACRDDVNARQVEVDHPQVDYDGMRDLILAHDRALLW